MVLTHGARFLVCASANWTVVSLRARISSAARGTEVALGAGVTGCSTCVVHVGR